MAGPQRFAARRDRALNRLFARLARRHSRARGFVSQPEPRTIGGFARGRQLMAGNLMARCHGDWQAGSMAWYFVSCIFKMVGDLWSAALGSGLAATPAGVTSYPNNAQGTI